MVDWGEIQRQRDAVYAAGGQPVLKSAAERGTGENLNYAGGLYNTVAPSTQATYNDLVKSGYSPLPVPVKAAPPDLTLSYPDELTDVPKVLPEKLVAAEPWSPIGGPQVATNLSTLNGTSTGFFDGLGDMFSGLGNALPLMLLMGMGGGRNNQMMNLMMLMMLGNGTSLGGGTMTGAGASLGQIDIQQVMLWGLLPSMGTTATMLLGGLSGMIGSKLMKPKRSYRRRTRVIYRNRYYRRRY